MAEPRREDHLSVRREGRRCHRSSDGDALLELPGNRVDPNQLVGAAGEHLSAAGRVRDDGDGPTGPEHAAEPALDERLPQHRLGASARSDPGGVDGVA